MTNLAEEAFDVASRNFAVYRGKATDPPPLDTCFLQNHLMIISEISDYVFMEVYELVPEYMDITNRLAAYLGHNPLELWFQGDFGPIWRRVCDFLRRLRQDLGTMITKCMEWRRQNGFGSLSATLREQWMNVPAVVVRGWLQQESAVECLT